MLLKFTQNRDVWMAVGKLTGPKKAAILLLAVGEEGAAEVMKNLEEADIQ